MASKPANRDRTANAFASITDGGASTPKPAMAVATLPSAM